jgi:hypothetical protein
MAADCMAELRARQNSFDLGTDSTIISLSVNAQGCEGLTARAMPRSGARCDGGAFNGQSSGGKRIGLDKVLADEHERERKHRSHAATELLSSHRPSIHSWSVHVGDTMRRNGNTSA